MIHDIPEVCYIRQQEQGPHCTDTAYPLLCCLIAIDQTPPRGPVKQGLII